VGVSGWDSSADISLLIRLVMCRRGCAVVGVLGSVLSGADPLTVVFSWTSALATIGIVGCSFLVSAAVIVFFQRNGLDKRVWNTLVAPVLSMAGLGYAMYLLVVNFAGAERE